MPMGLPVCSKAVNKLALGLPETRSIGGIPTWPQTMFAPTILPHLSTDIRICSRLYDAHGTFHLVWRAGRSEPCRLHGCCDKANTFTSKTGVLGQHLDQ